MCVKLFLWGGGTKSLKTVIVVSMAQEGLCSSPDLHHSEWKLIRLSGLRIQPNPSSLQHNPFMGINPGLSLGFFVHTNHSLVSPTCNCRIVAGVWHEEHIILWRRMKQHHGAEQTQWNQQGGGELSHLPDHNLMASVGLTGLPWCQ